MISQLVGSSVSSITSVSTRPPSVRPIKVRLSLGWRRGARPRRLLAITKALFRSSSASSPPQPFASAGVGWS